VNLQGALGVQLSPFVLETMKQMLDAAHQTVAWQPPIQILSDLRRKCAVDAANVHGAKMAGAKKGEKRILRHFLVYIPKVFPFAKCQQCCSSSAISPALPLR